jgi:hypothetical protein
VASGPTGDHVAALVFLAGPDGRQVDFYLVGDDHALLQRLIESAGPVAFLQDRQPTPDLVPIADLRISPGLMGKVPLRVYAAQPETVRHLSLRWIPQQHHHIIDIGSAAIEVDRCFLMEPWLGRAESTRTRPRGVRRLPKIGLTFRRGPPA